MGNYPPVGPDQALVRPHHLLPPEAILPPPLSRTAMRRTSRRGEADHALLSPFRAIRGLNSSNHRVHRIHRIKNGINLTKQRINAFSKSVHSVRSVV